MIYKHFLVHILTSLSLTYGIFYFEHCVKTKRLKRTQIVNNRRRFLPPEGVLYKGFSVGGITQRLMFDHEDTQHRLLKGWHFFFEILANKKHSQIFKIIIRGGGRGCKIATLTSIFFLNMI